MLCALMERNLWAPASLQALSGELLPRLLSQGKGSTGKYGSVKIFLLQLI